MSVGYTGRSCGQNNIDFLPWLSFFSLQWMGPTSAKLIPNQSHHRVWASEGRKISFTGLIHMKRKAGIMRKKYQKINGINVFFLFFFFSSLFVQGVGPAEEALASASLVGFLWWQAEQVAPPQKGGGGVGLWPSLLWLTGSAVGEERSPSLCGYHCSEVGSNQSQKDQ